MARAPEVCIKAVRMCLVAAAARGVDAAALAASYGLDPARIADPWARVPHDLLSALWDEAARLSGDDAFGLHAAELTHRSAYDAHDYTVLRGVTVGDVVRRMPRYARLLHEASEIRLEAEGEVIRYVQRFDCDPRPPRHFVEFVFATAVGRLRHISGLPAPALEIAFQHPEPADTAEHRRYFAAPIRFGAADNVITFAPSLLDAPTTAPDPTLVAVLERQLDEEADRLPPREDALGEVRARLGDDLSGGTPDLDRTARLLHTSRRSLQRRIQQAGTTFQALVDEARRDVVLRRLRDPSATLTDLAFDAGFSDTSAFYRAFRRWTGSTPAEYRRRGASIGAPGHKAGASGQ